ncbi:MAG TPA: phospholipase D-like domain-containing protein [bacterium]|nr:phospholipase D-like domain-containing protein [Victivallales bacterium]HPO52115.1 phospholipase D-like domain-containing protein [bacterium]
MIIKPYSQLKVVLTGLCVLIAVFFTVNASIKNNENSTLQNANTHILIVEPDDGKTPVINGINSAKKSIDLTIYSLNDPVVENALKSASAAGVKVRVLYNYYSFLDHEKEFVLKTMAGLESAGIFTRCASSDFAVTHQKTFTIDRRQSIIMTFNLRPNYFTNTRDFGIITNDKGEVSEISRVFDADWFYKKVIPKVTSLVWSNNNSRRKILSLIQSANVSLEIYNEELEDKQCLDALIMKAKSGVNVRIISAQMIEGGYDKNKNNRKYLNQHGVKAKYMPTNDYLYCHAKMVLVDYGTSNAKAFVGSENFSSTSLDKNRELGIIVNKTDILNRLHSVFETDWDKCQYD